jgi:histidine triad (HIT) family protein
MNHSECLFCRIADQEVPSRLVYESKHVVAFLDIRPIRRGHVLVVPREHFPYYDDLPTEVASEMMSVAQRLAPVLRANFNVGRVGLFFTGVDIAHAHAHVVPMLEPTDITSRQYIAEQTLTFRPAPLVPAVELDASAALIKSALAGAATVTPNPSIEGTLSGLRPPSAPHVKR